MKHTPSAKSWSLNTIRRASVRPLPIAENLVLSPPRLEAAGWVDVGHALNGSSLPTVPTATFKGTEFAIIRCDYLLASQALAATAKSYQVIRNAVTDSASDHYPVIATFEVPQ